jgi:hypothetical protein
VGQTFESALIGRLESLLHSAQVHKMQGE